MHLKSFLLTGLGRYLGGGLAAIALIACGRPADASGPDATAASKEHPAPITEAQMKRGKAVFQANCIACHQIYGQGLPGIYPPLARSDFLQHYRDRAAIFLLRGQQGTIKVNGKTYQGVMPNLNLNDRQIADVLTYVSNSWGNHEGSVAAKTVAEQRKWLAKHPEGAPQTSPMGGG